MIKDKKILKHLISTLSQRQISVLKKLADDKRPKDIADDLKVSVKTVELEVFNLRKLFDCKGTAGLVALAYRNEVVRWASFNDEMPKEGQLIIVYEWQYDAYATYFEIDKEADYSNSWWCLPPCR